MRVFKAAAAFAFLAAFSVPQIASAQGVQQASEAPGTLLSVSADGMTTGRPDMATVSLGVVTEAPTAAAAMQQNAQRMTALIAALRRAGVAERDIQTSNISVNPQQQYRENQPPLTTGYQASNQVTAKVRNLDSLGRVIDASVGAGGNSVNGVSFSYQDPDAQVDAARRDAITKARARANLYAQALNMRVGRIVSVSEGGGWSPPVPMPMMAMRAEAANQASTPVAPGEVETHATVNIVFELR